MSKSAVKASRKSKAVTQPKKEVIITGDYVEFHGEFGKKVKAFCAETGISVEQLMENALAAREAKLKPGALAIVPKVEESKPPFDPRRTYLVAEWKSYDKTWEQLLFDDETETFYLDWSWCDPEDVTASEALLWYGQKRMMECEYGELDWRGLHHLIKRAARDLREWEEVKKYGVEGVKKRRDEAAAEFFGKAVAK